MALIETQIWKGQLYKKLFLLAINLFQNGSILSESSELSWNNVEGSDRDVEKILI